MKQNISYIPSPETMINKTGGFHNTSEQKQTNRIITATNNQITKALLTTGDHTAAQSDIPKKRPYIKPEVNTIYVKIEGSGFAATSARFSPSVYIYDIEEGGNIDDNELTGL